MNLETILENFDYHVECDDFLLYELGRLIEEDRASLDDEEFRELIDEGIHEHVETRLELRAEIARRLRITMPHIAENDCNCRGARRGRVVTVLDPERLSIARQGNA